MEPLRIRFFSTAIFLRGPCKLVQGRTTSRRSMQDEEEKDKEEEEQLRVLCSGTRHDSAS